MKKLLLIFLIIVALLACTDAPTGYTIDLQNAPTATPMPANMG